MTKKACIQRPYPPPMADIEELSYQTTISTSTIRLYVRKGWLPPPHQVGNKKLWIMSEVMAHIAKINKMEENGGAQPANTDFDEYEKAISNVAPVQKTDDRAA